MEKWTLVKPAFYRGALIGPPPPAPGRARRARPPPYGRACESGPMQRHCAVAAAGAHPMHQPPTAEPVTVGFARG